MSVRLKQWAIIGVGAVVATAMLWLGLWQMQVFTDEGNRTAQDRAQQAPVRLLDFVGADGSVGDVYGKPVIAEGKYLPGQEEIIASADGTLRVLAPLQLDDGRVLPVVRGTVSAEQARDSVPPPPAGRVTQIGVLLPSEPGAESEPPSPFRLASVRLPLLAQYWTQPLTPGFITLGPDESARQRLAPAALELPSGDGSWRNSGYAMQWWVFAAFGFGMCLKIAHGVGVRAAAERAAAVEDAL